MTNNPKIFAFDTSTSEVRFSDRTGSLTYLNVEFVVKSTNMESIPCFRASAFSNPIE